MMTTTTASPEASPTTAPQIGSMTLWSSPDGSVAVEHYFGGTTPRIEIRKAGEAVPVRVIPTTRFWRVEQREAIDEAQQLAGDAPSLALTDRDEPIGDEPTDEA